MFLKIRINAFLIFLLISVVINAVKGTNNIDVPKARIILVNPGIFYIRSIDQLIKDKILDTAILEFEAVFYSKCEIKRSDTDDYIKEKNLDYIKSSEVNGDLNNQTIYRINECSDQFRQIFENSDGIIFFGGWDIPPVYYGQKTKLTTDINTPNRHLFELSFLFHLLGRNQNPDHYGFLHTKPAYSVFGICLGMQSMNVATGGDMYQDIPSDIYRLDYVEDVLKIDPGKMHRNYNKHLYPENEINSHSYHKVKILDKDIKSALNVEDRFYPLVVSSHHQAVKKPGKDMLVAATSMDGKVIEMLRHKNFKNVFGTQFHPEFYTIYDPGSDKFKLSLLDKNPMTEHEMIKKNGSFNFHTNIWKYFSLKVIESKNSRSKN
jgi:putative glutamine amidotransferase